MGTHNICGEAILMNTHNICFYGEMKLGSKYNLSTPHPRKVQK